MSAYDEQIARRYARRATAGGDEAGDAERPACRDTPLEELSPPDLGLSWFHNVPQ
ncbi:hypothetical protein [Sorangium sp. So ce385]|uniref:hypothetical protein n=1 Tax=Sorangium sp. So ce385 TaxID=3133308 RepID=UPI003F5C5B61